MCFILLSIIILFLTFFTIVQYDLISIVKGYGTYEENSTPMFDINIPTIDITNGEHQIEIQVHMYVNF